MPLPDPKTEALLVQLQAGSEAALKSLYIAQKQPFIHWLLKNYRFTEAEAEEIYQDCMLFFYNRVREGKFDGSQCRLQTYLFAIGHNVALDRLRKKRRRPTHAPQNDELQAYVDRRTVDDFFVNTIAADNQSERVGFIRRQLDKLTNPCREIIMFFYFRRMSLNRIAEQLNYNTADVVKTQKRRCMGHLVAYLREEDPTI